MDIDNMLHNASLRNLEPEKLSYLNALLNQNPLTPIESAYEYVSSTDFILAIELLQERIMSMNNAEALGAVIRENLRLSILDHSKDRSVVSDEEVEVVLILNTRYIKPVSDNIALSTCTFVLEILEQYKKVVKDNPNKQDSNALAYTLKNKFGSVCCDPFVHNEQLVSPLVVQKTQIQGNEALRINMATLLLSLFDYVSFSEAFQFNKPEITKVILESVLKLPLKVEKEFPLEYHRCIEMLDDNFGDSLEIIQEILILTKNARFLLDCCFKHLVNDLVDNISSRTLVPASLLQILTR